MSDYALSIVTYDRGERWDDSNDKKPYHWSFFLALNNDKVGRVCQLRGMPGGFYYDGEENEDLKESAGIKEILEVGAVPAGKIDRFKELLNSVRIEKNESTKWNCQSWCLEALELLRLEGFFSEDYPNNVIQYWLRED
ncbi:hypothetical protein HYALB_00007256 [Hymenoscyphus albidus]|uniref:Uncharacterized protein n=1 Tax=Hymenoscyphus albidus TaxID=595503 RepID=A0A9N9LFC1_9HELO|nr:hypothetical protein HYALB_00007256 [Hymenoscyphus albidus]